MPTSTLNRLAAAAALGVLTIVFLVGGTPMAASAHDQVLSTSPASQEHLETAPQEVSMVFSDAVLQLGATILVVDEGGQDWALGDVRIEGSTVSQALNGALADGRYQVRWRVVSVDGHPISGTFDFSVGVLGQAPTASATPAADAALPDLGDVGEANASRDSAAPTPFLLVGLGGAVAGVLIFLLILTLGSTRRHRRSPRPDATSSPTSERDTP